MRDGASAAAMSDPALNRWFSRRWAELPNDEASHQPAELPPVADDVALTGLALLRDWRRQRDKLTALPR